MSDQSSLERKDRRKWIPEKSASYTVNSMYCFLQSQTVLEAIDDYTLQAIHKLWMKPSKVENINHLFFIL
ncbi:hypothetical protein A2U01_0001320 [Trifolium medium]|uniref:Uncharacterized protein n=1 Tax=Trifolium medium TaxID=97028 RepID=A0A392LZV2_9FABA|nr:hypothetical protein [Trifolium medium]